MFDLALREGIAGVPDAPRPLREFFETVEAIPTWVDWDKVHRGQRALRASGADGLSIARDVALLGGYQFSGFNKTLLRTGALEKGSNRRFAETAQWARCHLRGWPGTAGRRVPIDAARASGPRLRTPSRRRYA